MSVRRQLPILAGTILFLALGALAAGRLADGLGRRPHVVLIVIDTLRADRLGAWGYPEPVSPELDRLAEEGVRFARVVAPSSWTRPSIGALLTARHPRSLGIYRERHDILPDEAETLAEVLRSAGYRTYGATANPNLNTIFNFQQGFDAYVDSLAVWAWMDGAAEGGALIRKEAPIRPARDLFAEAREWIARPEQAGRPLFLQFDVMEVHEHKFPKTRRPRVRSLFPGHPERGYLQAVRQASIDVGALVSDLASLSGWGDAIFVITSDHGEGLRDHPGVAGSANHGRTLYESQIHVPLILYSPGSRLPAGMVVERPVRLLDVMPTILDLVGAEGPERMEGVSLTPLFRGPDVMPEITAPFVFETEFQGVDKIGITEGEWKLVLSDDEQRGTDRLELQANAGPEDGARTNRAGDHPEIVRRLAAELRRWQRENPRAPARQPGGDGPSESERRQLEALGYVD